MSKKEIKEQEMLESWKKLVKNAVATAINSGQKVLTVRTKGLKNELWEISLEGERKLKDLKDSVRVTKKKFMLKRK